MNTWAPKLNSLENVLTSGCQANARVLPARQLKESESNRFTTRTPSRTGALLIARLTAEMMPKEFSRKTRFYFVYFASDQDSQIARLGKFELDEADEKRTQFMRITRAVQLLPGLLPKLEQPRTSG